MNLPKYVPGLVAVVQETTPTIYPEGTGMFVIANGFIDHEEWHYQDYDGKVQVHESEIVGIVNNGFYVAADRFNGVKEAPNRAPEVEEFEEMMKEEPQEVKDFIAKHSKKVTKIEVKDGDAETTK